MAFRILVSPKDMRHNHYHYSFKFNNISLSYTNTECNLQEQKELFEEQLAQQKKFSYLIKKGMYLAYYDDKFCITADTVKSKRASDATATKTFHCLNVNLDEMLPVDQLSATVDKYITEQAIMEIFHPRVISACIIDEEFKQLQKQLDTIVYNSLDRALITSQPSHVVMEIGRELKEL